MNIRAGNVKMIYKANAYSNGSVGHLSMIMPAMVKSVFEDFPGKSGETRTSSQPIDEN
jgi:hypothetical protein